MEISPSVLPYGPYDTAFTTISELCISGFGNEINHTFVFTSSISYSSGLRNYAQSEIAQNETSYTFLYSFRSKSAEFYSNF